MKISQERMNFSGNARSSSSSLLSSSLNDVRHHHVMFESAKEVDNDNHSGTSMSGDGDLIHSIYRSSKKNNAKKNTMKGLTRRIDSSKNDDHNEDSKESDKEDETLIETDSEISKVIGDINTNLLQTVNNLEQLLLFPNQSSYLHKAEKKPKPNSSNSNDNLTLMMSHTEVEGTKWSKEEVEGLLIAVQDQKFVNKRQKYSNVFDVNNKNHDNDDTMNRQNQIDWFSVARDVQMYCELYKNYESTSIEAELSDYDDHGDVSRDDDNNMNNSSRKSILDQYTQLIIRGHCPIVKKPPWSVCRKFSADQYLPNGTSKTMSNGSFIVCNRIICFCFLVHTSSLNA